MWGQILGGLAGGLLGGSGGDSNVTSTQTTTVDPRFGGALDYLLGETLGLTNQPQQLVGNSISNFSNLASQGSTLASGYGKPKGAEFINRISADLQNIGSMTPSERASFATNIQTGYGGEKPQNYLGGKGEAYMQSVLDAINGVSHVTTPLQPVKSNSQPTVPVSPDGLTPAGASTVGRDTSIPAASPSFGSNELNVVAPISPFTEQGIGRLSSPTNQAGQSVLGRTINGGFLNSNPFTGPVNTGGNNQYAGASNRYAGQSNRATGVNPFASNTNPFASGVSQSAGMANNAANQTGIAGVQDAVIQAATKAVGDRFSQAGRSGSPGEGLALAGEVTRQLAPYAFSANESQANRQFAGEEARLGRMTNTEQQQIQNRIGTAESRLGRMTSAGESALSRQFAGNEARIGRQTNSEQQRLQNLINSRESGIGRTFAANQDSANRKFSSFDTERARQLAAIPALSSMQNQDTQNLLTAGAMQEQQALERQLAPLTRLNMISDPIIRAMGGAGSTTSYTQPVNQNQTAGALGGALTGLQLGGALGGMFQQNQLNSLRVPQSMLSYGG